MTRTEVKNTNNVTMNVNGQQQNHQLIKD